VANPELDAFLGARPHRELYHWLSVGVIVVALAVAFVLLGRFVNGPDLAYYTAPVERGDITPVISGEGTLHAVGEVTVTATGDGAVQSLPGPAQGPVNAGQLLVTMDNASLLAEQTAAQAQQMQAQGDVDRAKLSLSEAQIKLARYDSVWRKSQGRVPSLNEMEGARANVGRASIAASSAQAALSAAQAKVKASQAKLAGSAISAPAAGVVVARLVAPGQGVQAGAPLFTLAPSIDRLMVAVSLDAAQAQRLAIHAHARVLAPALSDGPRNATLDRLDPGPGDGRQFAVFTLDAPGAPLKPGMPVTVDIDLPARQGVLLVPNAALTFAPEGKRPGGSVYVLAQHQQPRQVPVAVGSLTASIPKSSPPVCSRANRSSPDGVMLRTRIKRGIRRRPPHRPRNLEPR
jgi:HlyD family secretion protein